MVDEIIDLGTKLLGKDFVNSKEFTTFTAGNPHPLRIKIEGEVARLNNVVTFYETWTDPMQNEDARRLIKRRDDFKELDKLIMDYIESNLEQ